MKTIGYALITAVMAATLAAPWLAPNPPERQHPDLLYAPPTTVYLPGHIYKWRLVSRLERVFEEDRSQRYPIRFLDGRRFLSAGEAPLLILGADSYGRDVLARLLYAGRVSLALAICATLFAVLVGALVGAVAGYAGGWLDELLSRGGDFVLLLPATYVVLALRAVMPLVLPPFTVFMLLTIILAIVGAPIVARGVRAVVASERQRDYIAAARAVGAGPPRLLIHHLLPAAHGHVMAQAALLLPAFILAEATLSYVGLGFPQTVPTWGTMLGEAANASIIVEAPWMLAPAGAIFLVVLAANLVVQGDRRGLVELEK